MISQFFFTYPPLVGLISFFIGWAAMPIVLKIAKAKHFVVKPNKRTSHKGEVPNIGGLDIFFSFMLTYMVFEYNHLQEYQFLLIGIFVIFLIGFVDDILDLTPLSKLLGEILAGVAMIGFSDIRISHLHGFLGIGEINVYLSYALSFFVLIAIINALNLIDGIDGLASGLGILYSLFFAFYFYLIGQREWMLMACALVGSLSVFFIYNVSGKKNKIFMGDSGSLLLGFVISCFVFHVCEINAYHQVPEAFHMRATPAVMICVLSVPLFDMARVALTRIKHHKSPFLPDRNHIHHLLLSTGLNHLQTTCVLLAVSVLFIALAIVGRNWSIWLLLGADLLLCTLLTYILWRVVDKKNKERIERGEAPTDNTQPPAADFDDDIAHISDINANHGAKSEHSSANLSTESEPAKQDKHINSRQL